MTYFHFMFMFQFIFMFHILLRFHAYSIWHFRYLYRNTDVFTHRSCILVPPCIYFSYKLESFQLNHPNSSYGIFMPTSRFTDFTEGQFTIFIFQCLVSIFDTGSLYSFKSKVLRVLFQLESPNSEHRNTRYVRNNSDYSMIKLMQELDYTWPHFE